MQRPRITKKLAAALREGRGHLTAIYEEIAQDPTHPLENRLDLLRTINYLDDTIAWAKAQERKAAK